MASKHRIIRTFRLFDIDWDTSSDVGSYSKAPSAGSLGLPSERLIHIEKGDNFDPDEDGADLLSDTFGFCVNGFQWEEVKK